MPNWVSVILLIVLVAGVALLRETWRLRDVTAYIDSAGFARLPGTDTAWQATAAPLVTLMHPSGARIWGLALAGALDDVPVTIAEHESSRGISQDSRWFTIVVWPLRTRADGAVVLTEASNATVAAVTSTLTTLGTGVRLSEQLGITDPVPAEYLPTRVGRFEVTGDPGARERWLTHDPDTALNDLPADARYVRDGAYGGWRFEGTINRERLEWIRTMFPGVRRALDHTP